MKKTFKKMAAAVMAVATVAIGMTGMTANAAYNSSDSALLRSVAGAPGNVTSATRTIATISTGKYKTSYNFAYSNSTATVYVTPTNVSGKNTTLSTSKKSDNSLTASTSGKTYITYSAKLSCRSGSESGTWKISVR